MKSIECSRLCNNCCFRNEGLHSPATSGTFLVEDGPFYFCMLEILLGRLSESLYKKVSFPGFRNDYDSSEIYDFY